jgi:hypothetical protein
MAKLPQHATRKPASGHKGKGGSRHGYQSGNEIEDMEIFDGEPGKDPSGDGGRSPAPNDDEIEKALSLRSIRLGLGTFECKQDATPKVGRVVDCLESRRRVCPVVVAEITVARTRCDDEIVERYAAALGDHFVTLGVDTTDLGKYNARVLLPTQDRSNWLRNVGGRQARGCDLIKEWLKKVVVMAINDHDLEWRLGQRFRCGQSGKTCAEDNNARQGWANVSRFHFCHSYRVCDTATPHGR